MDDEFFLFLCFLPTCSIYFRNQINYLGISRNFYYFLLFFGLHQTLTRLIYIKHCFFFSNYLIYKQMKRSFAPPRRDKPAGGTGKVQPTPQKKPPVKTPQEKGPQNQKTLAHSSQPEIQDKTVTHRFEQKYRNKNLTIIPAQMLVTLSALTTLDISYNKLSDSQIELIMNSCTKLSTFCIQGNMTNLIPIAFSKLKLLKNFRHDWIKLGSQEMYQPQKKLQKIKQIITNPQIVTKINKVTGLDFLAYCQFIAEVIVDKNLIPKIESSDCTAFGKQHMLRNVDEVTKGKPAIRHIKELDEKSETETLSTNIIQEGRDNLQKQLTQMTTYKSPGFPIHELFGNFDKNPKAAAQIDGLLVQGINPNIHDTNGLTPYHVCVIQGQKLGLQYLLKISSNNPGFFDLEMPTIKEGWSILHLSVHLKNYQFARMLIQFGLPINKRDSTGSRLLHLVEGNFQFIFLLKKLFKKKSHMARNLSALSVPTIPHQNKKNYVKHPNRQRQQSRLRITSSQNYNLIEMFQAATDIPKA